MLLRVDVVVVEYCCYLVGGWWRLLPHVDVDVMIDIRYIC